MEPVAVRPLSKTTRTLGRRVVGAVPDPSGAWLLDVVGFHATFDEWIADLGDPDGLVSLRERATDLWRSADPTVAAYVASLPCHTPEEWHTTFDEAHLAEWYRVCMAAYVTPAAGFRWPVRLRNRLSDLGWTPADARRLARGRPLVTLADSFGAPATAATVTLVLPADQKGWLAADDVDEFLHRFHTMDPTAFRGHQHLIPVVEDAYEVLQAVAFDDNRVLLLAAE